MKPGQNYHEPIQHVRHADLERSSESPFRSKCPVCPDGILPVSRDGNTFALVRHDRCCFCAQAFHYTDDAIAGEPLT